MTIDVFIFSLKRKNPLSSPCCREGVRFSFQNLFKAKEVSVSHANWLKLTLLTEPKKVLQV